MLHSIKYHLSRKIFNGIFPIPAFSDNYIWAIIYQGIAVIVDPGEAKPVFDFLRSNNLKLLAILLTHYHHDHIDGVLELSYKNEVIIFGPNNKEQFPYCDIYLNEGNCISFPHLGISFQIMETPGHTIDHISYYGHTANCPKSLFCGDALFSGGCGRIYGSTSEQLFYSLKKLSALPKETNIFCAHEYTVNNLKWAIEVDSNNFDLKRWYDRAVQLKKEGYVSLPSSIEKELKINPFLRTKYFSISNAVSIYFKKKFSTELDVFSALRKWKDEY